MGRTAVITGDGSAIGFPMANRLHPDNFTVTTEDLDKDKTEQKEASFGTKAYSCIRIYNRRDCARPCANFYGYLIIGRKSPHHVNI